MLLDTRQCAHLRNILNASILIMSEREFLIFCGRLMSLCCHRKNQFLKRSERQQSERKHFFFLLSN